MVSLGLYIVVLVPFQVFSIVSRVKGEQQSKMPEYKLHYFNFRGLGELSRLILHYAQVPFEDIRIDRSDWPELKKGMFY